MIKLKREGDHYVIKGKVKPEIAEKELSQTRMLIQHKLFVLETKEQRLEPIVGRLKGNSKLFMERITGTTLLLSNMRKIIYDISFADLYNHTGIIPENHVAIENNLYKVDACCHIDNEEEFLTLLNKQPEPAKGICFYIDDVLYASNVKMMKVDEIRNDLLHARNKGDRPFFSILKIKDASGNITEYRTRLTPAKIKAKNEANARN
jgi:hypothetical protein